MGVVIRTGVLRELVSSSRTYYVRKDGSDSNTGLADNSGGAFLTIGKYLSTVGALDLSAGVIVTGQVRADGSPPTSYAEVCTIPTIVGAGSAVLTGDTSTLTNIRINPASGNCLHGQDIFGAWTIQGFDLITADGQCVWAVGPAVKLTLGNMRYGGTGASGHHIFTSQNSIVSQTSATISVAGDFGVSLSASNSRIDWTGNTVTIAGRPNLSGAAYAYTEANGYIRAFATTFKGALTFTANAGTNVITATAHGFSSNDPLQFQTSGTLPAGLSAGTIYYKIDDGTDTFKVSASAGPGAEIDITDAGTGTHTVFCVRTGKKYSSTQNGIILVNGAGAGYFPGAAVGTTATQGQYI